MARPIALPEGKVTSTRVLPGRAKPTRRILMPIVLLFLALVTVSLVLDWFNIIVR
jgi:hypothetical protein